MRIVLKIVDAPYPPSVKKNMHSRAAHPIKISLGLSIALHVAFFAALVTWRAGPSFEAPALTVNWVEPIVGEDSLISRAGQAAHPAPAPRAKTPVASPSPSTTSASAQVSEGTLETGAQALARRLSAEDAYIASVRKELETRKVYPTMAKRLGQVGRVTLHFVVAKDGSVQKSELVSLSAFSALNQAAVALLANRFSPIPEELQKATWEFTIPVEYRLE